MSRIVNKTETIQGTTHVFGYTYDGNGRLTDVTTDANATSHYEYDANGNRLVGPGLTASPVYDNQDRLLSYGNCTYTYKADGSLQTKTCADGTTTYDYDGLRNLRGVTLGNGTAIIYLIDGQSRRVGKKVNGTLIESFLYEDDLKRVGWYDGAGNLKAQFVFRQGSHLPEYMVKAGQNYKLVYDQVGTIREVIAPDGSIAERIDYDEFGNVLTDTAPGQQPFGFGGGLRDIDTGLIRFGARDFETITGRWLVRDALRFSSGDANLYRYVASDPINHRDPTGYSGEEALPIGIPLAIPLCVAQPELCILIPAILYCQANPGACWSIDLFKDPPPFYPGWKPPEPAPTTCTMEPPAPPPPPPPQVDCELLFTQCVARGRSVVFCLAIRLICEFGGG